MCKDLVTCLCKCADCINLITIKATQTDPADASCKYDSCDDDGTCQYFSARSDEPNYPKFDEYDE